MALTLHLLRHAKSSWAVTGQEDHERPLNGRGRKAADLVGRFLAREGPIPTRVLCSSSARTRETWARVATRLDPEPPVSFERQLYLAPANELLQRIQGEPDEGGSCLLLVAHNPGAADLGLRLAGSGDETAWRRMRTKYPTAALATLAFPVDHWREIRPRAGELVRFVVPRDLGDGG